MRRQIVNRFVRHARGASGPYTRKLGRGKFARSVVKRRNGVEGNIWTDNPDTVGANWVDNGNKTYTASGAEGTGIEQSTTPGQLLDDQTYSVSFTVSGYASGNVSFFLGGQSKFVSTTPVSANGSYQQNVNIFSSSSPVTNLIYMDGSSSFTGTVSNIVVVPA